VATVSDTLYDATRKVETRLAVLELAHALGGPSCEDCMYARPEQKCLAGAGFLTQEQARAPYGNCGPDGRQFFRVKNFT
jgi:hypothetical protein